MGLRADCSEGAEAYDDDDDNDDIDATLAVPATGNIATRAADAANSSSAALINPGFASMVKTEFLARNLASGRTSCCKSPS